MKLFSLPVLIIIGVLTLQPCFAEKPAAAEQKSKASQAPFRHAVFFRFKKEVTDEEIEKIEKAFVALPAKIKEIKDFEWGTSESVEGLNDDFTHCFFVTFENKAGLEIYIPHPDHKAFVALLKDKLDKVFVFDYTAK